MNEKSAVFRILKKAYKPVKILKYGFGIFKVANDISYFPEEKRKSYFKRLYENFKWLIRYGTPNDFYNLYGFDIANSEKIGGVLIIILIMRYL